MSVLLWVAAVASALALAGVLFQAAGGAVDRRMLPPPGRLVDVGELQLHVYEEGSGEPAIILESGIAASSLNWRALQRELAKSRRVVAYDRAGFAWSGAARTARTIANIVDELQELVKTLGLTAPPIFVAHSFGSLIVREYARRHPVKGIVLLDPIDCEHWRTLNPEGAARLQLGVRFSRRGAFLARLGVVRFALLLAAAGARALPKGIARAASGGGAAVVSRIAEEVGKMPRDLWPHVRAHWSNPQSFTTMAAYLDRLRTCVNEVDYATLALPLIVISAGKASAAELREHRRLAALSPWGEHIIAENSGHWVHLDRPDVVIEAVRRMANQ